MRTLPAMFLVIAAACGGGGGGSTPGPTAPDPVELGADVKQAELETTIKALSAIPTRFTMTQGDEMARDYLVGRIQALGLTAELDPFPVQNQTANNIIVKIAGAEQPEVIYMFSAHYDSTSSTPTTSAPGADDNATGVAAVLEAARILSQHRFKHSVWLVFTAAEEQGSLGSKHLADALRAQSAQVKGVIAPDMIGYWPQGEGDKFDILGDPASKFLVDQMAAMADRMGVANKTYINHGYCYGDDHTMFQEAGFPAISPMDCVEAHNIGGEQTPHYHQTSDTFETLNMPFTTKVAGVITATLAELAGPLPPLTR